MCQAKINHLHATSYYLACPCHFHFRSNPFTFLLFSARTEKGGETPSRNLFPLQEYIQLRGL